MKSLAELQALRDKVKASMNVREEDGEKIRVVVGMATCGIASGARPVLNAFIEEVSKRNLDNVSVTQTGCIGICQYEPIVEVFTPDGKKTTYIKMTEEKVAHIVAEHIVNGSIVNEYTIGTAKQGG